VPFELLVIWGGKNKNKPHLGRRPNPEPGPESAGATRPVAFPRLAWQRGQAVERVGRWLFRYVTVNLVVSCTDVDLGRKEREKKKTEKKKWKCMFLLTIIKGKK